MDIAPKSSIECTKFEDINGKTYIDDEHILNFWSGTPLTLPEWFANKTCLKMCVAAGDGWDQLKNTDIEKLPEYDIYINSGTFNYSAANNLLNLQYIKDYHYHKKLICYADIFNQNHLDLLVVLFKNKCQFIGTDDFSYFIKPDEIGKQLLMIGGKLMNYPVGPKLQLLGVVYRSELPTPIASFECKQYTHDKRHQVCTKISE